MCLECTQLYQLPIYITFQHERLLLISIHGYLDTRKLRQSSCNKLIFQPVYLFIYLFIY
jgi:hypothetical protein